MTLACVPIMVADRPSALADAQLAADPGADIVEYRIDELFSGSGDEAEEADILADQRLDEKFQLREVLEGKLGAMMEALVEQQTAARLAAL